MTSDLCLVWLCISEWWAWLPSGTFSPHKHHYTQPSSGLRAKESLWFIPCLCIIDKRKHAFLMATRRSHYSDRGDEGVSLTVLVQVQPTSVHHLLTVCRPTMTHSQLNHTSLSSPICEFALTLRSAWPVLTVAQSRSNKKSLTWLAYCIWSERLTLNVHPNPKPWNFKVLFDLN